MQLGGKGANLCEMARLGLNVPPGFTVTTAMCEEYQKCGDLPPGLWKDILTSLKEVEAAYGKEFASKTQVRQPRGVPGCPRQQSQLSQRAVLELP
jgi:phosphoenolpyruvate synthase/pyruvate phosphate dikinase